MYIQNKSRTTLALMAVMGIASLNFSTAYANEAKVNASTSGQPKAVEHVDIGRYTGKWYTIAYLPMYFQRHCVSDTTANYTLNSDQSIHVLNTCKNKEGKIEDATGIAHAVNAGKSKLKVSFLPQGLRWLPFTQGDYWILRVDPNYQVALVGGSSTKYLWLLSRTPTIDEATYQSYLNTAREQGYDLSKLIKESHTLRK